MSSGLASDEVAEDYKNSLEDLTTNDRFQISNLTVIAKENTEHAMAISRVLENHIRSTPPAQKLPALYVVDSIVKNVGTPYTLFLGRNLYQTFMNAYTLVDSQTRKKLDEMLKTWKEPVPGSLDTRPVFPPEITRNIENALIKARTAALQQQQARSQQDILGRNRGAATPPGWKHTPTPPQNVARPPQSSGSSFPYQNPSLVQQQGPSSNNEPFPPRNTPTPQPCPTPPVLAGQQVDLGALNRDIETLILSARAEFSSNTLDTSVQQRLKALLDLQSILQRQELPQEQLRLVRDQVTALAPRPTPVPQSVAHTPQTLPIVSTGPLSSHITTTQHINGNSQHTPQPNLQRLLNPSTLAELIKATSNRQHPTPPPQTSSLFHPIQQPLTPQPASTASIPGTTENPLIAALRVRGLLPQSAPTTPPTTFNLPFFIPGQVRQTPPGGGIQPTPSDEIKINVQMNTASIKIPRLILINTLYESKSNRCGTCGRRFSADEEGKEKKARHLDWHFKTNQRMVEATKRGQNRSWYVDERDWIKSRDYDDDTGVFEGGAGSGSHGLGGESDTSTKAAQMQWIRTPNDVSLRNAPCPICQEKFESTWSEEVQDWIWQDAIKIGNRVYHASCYADVTKEGSAVTVARGSTPSARTGTPDSVLGKRKAEETDSPGKITRIKMESVS